MAIGEGQSSYDDPLHLSSSDHAAMQLTSRQFDGNNYTGWARSARMALATKSKLGFVTGECGKPTEGASSIQRWSRCDSMVSCWILNSLVPDVAEGFGYLNSSKELWDELCERFGQTNGPLIYQLKLESSDLKQKESRVTAYYTKLKRNWDELSSVDPIPRCNCVALKTCTCDVLKKIQAIEARNQLLQFLMGLDPDYEQIRSQILGMDPLPTVNRAYYLVLQIERQKQITSAGIEGHRDGYEACAAARINTGSSGGINFANSKKEHKKSKFDKVCTHCKGKGHTHETCFKLIGYPDWYKGGKGGTRMVAHVDNEFGDHEYEESPLADHTSIHSQVDATADLDQSMVSAVTLEVIKALKLKKQAPGGSTYAAANSAGLYY